ncbi:MAG: transcriptional regulator, partial [Bacteroidales bacterium]|nr:transcriptional regulator [Bacteroidales bacterium]
VTPQVTPQVKELILAVNGELNRSEIQEILEITDRKYLREQYLHPALDLQLIEMTQPHSPNSPTQKYRLTKKGEEFKNKFHE